MSSADPSDVLRLKAVELVGNGKYGEAVKTIEQIKDKDREPDVYFLLGVSYSRLGDHGQAVKVLRKFETFNTDNKDFHYYLGISLFELGRYDEAIAEFRKSELLGIKVEESTYYSGYIYFSLSEYKTAFPFFIRTIKENGKYSYLAHYYAGVCLYRDGLNSPESLDAAVYHFEKVTGEDTIAKEAARYIDVINEYISSGVARYKKRWNLNAYADLLFSRNRTVTPLDGIVNMGLDTETWTVFGDLYFKGAFSPVMFKNIAVFLNYGFSTDLAFKPGLGNSNTQGHLFGISVQYYSQLRTFEAGAEYYYSIDYLDDGSLEKIAGAHVISVGIDKSILKSWALGLKLPMRFYNGTGGAWGDFTGRSIEIALMSYHMFGEMSFRLEPSLIMFSSADNPDLDHKYYNVGIKANFPWKIWFFWPSLKGRAGYIITADERVLAYDGGIVLFVPLGIGMRGTYSGILRKGFVSDTLEMVTGIGFEYVF
ncbi:MAG: tetratricopeptide repeat protein [Oligoflexia bacterium]|nr:tetratricopeptide repeat protein [Oligoflexia bacterium]